MSTTPTSDLDRVVESRRLADLTPIGLDAAALDSTAPEYLRDLKRELAEDDLVPARLVVDARFDEDCSLATQEEADRIRGYVRAASFLGAAELTVECSAVENSEKVRPALAACAERARREGLQFTVHGPITL
jgi:sugar phosphate isomerase/epimerase